MLLNNVVTHTEVVTIWHKDDTTEDVIVNIHCTVCANTVLIQEILL